jgi:hypothetical protein
VKLGVVKAQLRLLVDFGVIEASIHKVENNLEQLWFFHVFNGFENLLAADQVSNCHQ